MDICMKAHVDGKKFLVMQKKCFCVLYFKSNEQKTVVWTWNRWTCVYCTLSVLFYFIYPEPSPLTNLFNPEVPYKHFHVPPLHSSREEWIILLGVCVTCLDPSLIRTEAHFKASAVTVRSAFESAVFLKVGCVHEVLTDGAAEAEMHTFRTNGAKTRGKPIRGPFPAF